MIIKTKPFILKRIHNMDEFIHIQKELFSKGYCWINNSEIYRDSNFMNFPIYLSNIEICVNEDKFTRLRETFGKHCNNVLFFSHTLKDFKKTDLRKCKLEKLRECSG